LTPNFGTHDPFRTWTVSAYFSKLTLAAERVSNQVLSTDFSDSLRFYALTSAAITASVVRMACAKVGPLISCAACIASALNAAVASRTSVT
jgi:hypothetical protein